MEKSRWTKKELIFLGGIVVLILGFMLNSQYGIFMSEYSKTKAVDERIAMKDYNGAYQINKKYYNNDETDPGYKFNVQRIDYCKKYNATDYNDAAKIIKKVDVEKEISNYVINGYVYSLIVNNDNSKDITNVEIEITFTDYNDKNKIETTTLVVKDVIKSKAKLTVSGQFDSENSHSRITKTKINGFDFA